MASHQTAMIVISTRQWLQAGIAARLNQRFLTTCSYESCFPAEARTLQAERTVTALTSVTFLLATVRIARK